MIEDALVRVDETTLDGENSFPLEVAKIRVCCPDEASDGEELEASHFAPLFFLDSDFILFHSEMMAASFDGFCWHSKGK